MSSRERSAPPTQYQAEQPAPSEHYRRIVESQHITQTLMEIQGTLARLDERSGAMKSSLDGLKGKVEDLVSWKSKILGGAITLGAVLALLASLVTFAVTKFSGYVSFHEPTHHEIDASQSHSQSKPPGDSATISR
jgi:hypothetical protein